MAYHKLKPKGSLIAALDIGSTKIACLIGRITDNRGNIEVLGVGHRASQGVKAGSIIDLDATDQTVRQAVHAAEDMAAETMRGYPLREIVVGIPSVHVSSRSLSIDVQVSGHEVTDRDIARALSKAKGEERSGEWSLIHTIPEHFSLDGTEGITDPRGMYGDVLNVGLHAVLVRDMVLKNINACVERSHLDIDCMCASAYAAGLSSLVEDEMGLGCTVVDMGGGTTSIAVFSHGAMIYCGAVPVGGYHITNDIAKGLGCSVTDAERIKTLYGAAIPSSSDDNELIDVPQVGDDDTGPNHIPRSALVGIIRPRMEEIMEMVRGNLEEAGLLKSAGKRMVLTGGGSQMTGVREMAQIMLEKQVRLGRPVRLNGLNDVASGPAFSTAAGLLIYAAQYREAHPGLNDRTAEVGSTWSRVRNWVRENW